jgi:hypothetical protein
MGILTGPPAAMRQDILNCVSWSSYWAQSDSDVYVIGATNNPSDMPLTDFPRPLAVITMTEESMETRVDTWGFTRGSMVVWFEDVVSSGCADETSAYNQFASHVEAVITELSGQGIASSLFRRGITPLQRPMRSRADDINVFYTASFNVSFGLA